MSRAHLAGRTPQQGVPSRYLQPTHVSIFAHALRSLRALQRMRKAKRIWKTGATTHAAEKTLRATPSKNNSASSVGGHCLPTGATSKKTTCASSVGGHGLPTGQRTQLDGAGQPPAPKKNSTCAYSYSVGGHGPPAGTACLETAC